VSGLPVVCGETLPDKADPDFLSTRDENDKYIPHDWGFLGQAVFLNVAIMCFHACLSEVEFNDSTIQRLERCFRLNGRRSKK